MANRKRGDTRSKSSEPNLFAEYLNLNSEGDFEGALEKLRLFQRDVLPNNQFGASLEIELLSTLGRLEDALELARRAVSFPPPEFSKLYMQFAQLLYGYNQDLELALSSVNKAIEVYDADNSTEDITSQLTNNDSFKIWVSEKAKNYSDMMSLRVDIKGAINANTLFNQIQQMQNEVSQEKVKTIELMAIFTAILALIFANVQFVKNLNIEQILIANLALTLVLTWLLHVARNIAQNEPILPRFIRPESITNFLGKTFGLVLVACMVATVFTVTVLLIVKTAEWIGLA